VSTRNGPPRGGVKSGNQHPDTVKTALSTLTRVMFLVNQPQSAVPLGRNPGHGPMESAIVFQRVPGMTSRPGRPTDLADHSQQRGRVRQDSTEGSRAGLTATRSQIHGSWVDTWGDLSQLPRRVAGILCAARFNAGNGR